MKKHYSSHYTRQSLNLHVLSWYHNGAKVDSSENLTAAGHSEAMTTISHFRSTANWPITHGSLLESHCVPSTIQPGSFKWSYASNKPCAKYCQRLHLSP